MGIFQKLRFFSAFLPFVCTKNCVSADWKCTFCKSPSRVKIGNSVHAVYMQTGRRVLKLFCHCTPYSPPLDASELAPSLLLTWSDLCQTFACVYLANWTSYIPVRGKKKQKPYMPMLSTCQNSFCQCFWSANTALESQLNHQHQTALSRVF